jgi:hypothetical protein
LIELPGEAVSNKSLYHIQEAIKLANRMIAMADDAVKNCEDDAALLVFSIIRDSAYKIRQTVTKEYKGAEKENRP